MHGAADMRSPETSPRGQRSAQATADLSPCTREGLAFVLLDRIAKLEGYAADDSRRYNLDLLRDILLTIDGKRAPPVVIPTIDRRGGVIDRREGGGTIVADPVSVKMGKDNALSGRF
jgi:hypothetical protein